MATLSRFEMEAGAGNYFSRARLSRERGQADNLYLNQCVFEVGGRMKIDAILRNKEVINLIIVYLFHC
jgi:hypothetical protein